MPTPIVETGYIINEQEVEIDAVQPDKLNEPMQNEIDGELNDMVPEIVNEDAVNEDEIESIPDNIHNDGGEDENTDNLMRYKALSQQQYDEQQHVLR